jgi:hypothetical protein
LSLTEKVIRQAMLGQVAELLYLGQKSGQV